MKKFPPQTHPPPGDERLTNFLCAFFAMDTVLVICQYVFFLHFYYNPLVNQDEGVRTMSEARAEVNHVASRGMHAVAMVVAIVTSIVAILVLQGTISLNVLAPRFIVSLELLANAGLNLLCMALFVMVAVAVHTFESRKLSLIPAPCLRPGEGDRAAQKAFKKVQPVCGVDGEKYRNAYRASCQGAVVECEGACPCPDEKIVVIPGCVFYVLYLAYACAEWYFAVKRFRGTDDAGGGGGGATSVAGTASLRPPPESLPAASSELVLPQRGKRPAPAKRGRRTRSFKRGRRARSLKN